MSEIAAYLIKKRGYWYRENAQGYTSQLWDAGLFTKEEARKHITPRSRASDQVTMVHIKKVLGGIERDLKCALEEATALSQRLILAHTTLTGRKGEMK